MENTGHFSPVDSPETWGGNTSARTYRPPRSDGRTPSRPGSTRVQVGRERRRPARDRFGGVHGPVARRRSVAWQPAGRLTEPHPRGCCQTPSGEARCLIFTTTCSGTSRRAGRPGRRRLVEARRRLRQADHGRRHQGVAAPPRRARADHDRQPRPRDAGRLRLRVPLTRRGHAPHGLRGTDPGQRRIRECRGDGQVQREQDLALPPARSGGQRCRVAHRGARVPVPALVLRQAECGEQPEKLLERLRTWFEETGG